MRKGQVALSCSDGDSYRYHVQETVITTTGSGQVILFCDAMPVVPVITVTAETTLSWNTGSDSFRKSISAGTWTIPELELSEGENTVNVTGAGTISFRYREGRL